MRLPIQEGALKRKEPSKLLVAAFLVFVLLLITLGFYKAAHAETAPFSENFDAYTPDSFLIGQGEWTGYRQGIWVLGNTPQQPSLCVSDKCLSAQGPSVDATRTAGAPVPHGSWDMKLYVNDAPQELSGFIKVGYNGQNGDVADIYPGTQSNTFSIKDNRSRTLFDNLAIRTWHVLTISWVVEGGACHFFVDVNHSGQPVEAVFYGAPYEAAYCWPSNGLSTIAEHGGVNSITFTAANNAAGWRIDDIEATHAEPVGCTVNCNSNVLFIPGTEASRLYSSDSGTENKLWEPMNNAEARRLFLDAAGNSAENVYTKEGDVFDEINYIGKNIYLSFIDTLKQLKSEGSINDWSSAPYDWRLTLEDVVNNGKQDSAGRIYYTDASGATSTPYIVQELRRLAATSKTGKVTIVAHSNGGLVTKALTNKLGADAGALIDKIIFVDVPQAGTPMAVAAALHGYDQEFGQGLILNENTARTFASTSPMVYHLMPSDAYFTYVTDPVITIDDSLPDWQVLFGKTIHSGAAMRQFLQSSYNRTDAQTGDIHTPIQLSADLLAYAKGVHDSLDSWTPPQGVELVQIAGWGIPKTLKGITYKKFGLGVKEDHEFTVDGDGTVVVPSQLWTSTSNASTTNYWVDLKTYNSLVQRLQGGHLIKVSHADVLDVPDIDIFIRNSILDLNPLDNTQIITSTAPADTKNRLTFALHSPLTLDLYDGYGNHTGVSTTTGQIEENIPGTYYAQYGDVKYLFTDTGVPLHIVMKGYATSTFTFDTKQLIGDTLMASTTWQDMPVTPQTKVTLDIGGEITAQSALNIDLNGDGTPEHILLPKINDTVVLPPPPKYAWSGFLPPIHEKASKHSHNPKIFKAGSSVPIKVQLKDAQGVAVQASSTPLWLPPQKLAQMHDDEDDEDDRESGYKKQSATGATFKWDSASRMYIYNWSTKGLAAGYWYKIFAKLDDGTVMSVVVGLK